MRAVGTNFSSSSSGRQGSRSSRHEVTLDPPTPYNEPIPTPFTIAVFTHARRASCELRNVFGQLWPVGLLMSCAAVSLDIYNDSSGWCMKASLLHPGEGGTVPQERYITALPEELVVALQLPSLNLNTGKLTTNYGVDPNTFNGELRIIFIMDFIGQQLNMMTYNQSGPGNGYQGCENVYEKKHVMK